MSTIFCAHRIEQSKPYHRIYFGYNPTGKHTVYFPSDKTAGNTPYQYTLFFTTASESYFPLNGGNFQVPGVYSNGVAGEVSYSVPDFSSKPSDYYEDLPRPVINAPQMLELRSFLESKGKLDQYLTIDEINELNNIKFTSIINQDNCTGLPLINQDYTIPQTFVIYPPAGKNITSLKLNGVEKLDQSVSSYSLVVSSGGDYTINVSSQAMLPLATNCKLRASFIPQGVVDETLGNVTYKLGEVKALAIGSVLEVTGVTPVNFPYTSRMDVLFFDANGVPAYFNGRVVLTPVDDNGSEIVDVYPFFNNQSKAPMVFNGSLFKAEKTKQFSWQCPATYIDIAGGSPPKWRFKIVELESVPLETEIPETGIDPEFPVTETQPYTPPKPNDPVEPGEDVTVIEITINQPSNYPQGNTYKEITDVLEVGFKDIVAAINTHETQVYEGFAKLVVVLNQIKNALPLITVNLENTLKTSLAEINNQLISVNAYLNAIQLQQQIQNSDDDAPDLTELIEELKKIREALYTAPSVGDPETIAQLQAGILTAWSENG